MPLGVLEPFDPPSLKPNCKLRNVSTNAPQALLMMNDPFVIAQVRALAERVGRQAGPAPRARFELAWRLVFGRRPSDRDIRDGVRFLKNQTAAVQQAATAAKTPDPGLTALAHLCHALVSSNRFLYVD